jgi:hypothetical protein
MRKNLLQTSQRIPAFCGLPKMHYLTLHAAQDIQKFASEADALLELMI